MQSTRAGRRRGTADGHGAGTSPVPHPSRSAGGPMERASDPVVAYDALHGTWLIASLALRRGDAAAVVVSRSSDGLTWSAPVTCSRPHGGRTCCSTRSGSSAQRRRQSPPRQLLRPLPRLPHPAPGVPGVPGRRTDLVRPGGRSGRRRPQLDRRPVGTCTATGREPDGDLIVPYYDEDRVAAIRSADGGRSLLHPVTVAPTQFKPTPGLRAPPLPTAEVDRDGTIYVVWPDCGQGCTRNDLVIASSADGIDWAPVVRIPLGGGADFVIPGIAADPANAGRTRADLLRVQPGRFLDVGFVTSTNGGRRWSAPRRLTPGRYASTGSRRRAGRWSATTSPHRSRDATPSRCSCSPPLRETLQPAALRRVYSPLTNCRTASESASMRQFVRGE